MNRADRRRQERERIKNQLDKGGSWEVKISPNEANVGHGWFGELNKAFSNGKYAVMSRMVQSDWGLLEHACIRNHANSDIPWAEKQRIKNELFGKDRVAIEVFPSESELVDEANMYHIWILPKNMELPFSLKT